LKLIVRKGTNPKYGCYERQDIRRPSFGVERSGGQTMNTIVVTVWLNKIAFQKKNLTVYLKL
jgi:hypothetical protein